MYYRDRLDFEAERDRKERSGELEIILIDRDKALEIAERAAGRKIDDLQIISTKDPNIKEIVGADAIAGRAYHVGNGKIVIVADNIGDYAKAMGTIAEEGRHIYHRNNNGLEDSEDYASFYGRQFERYNRKKFEDKDANFVTEQLRYTKEQLGNDWENAVKLVGFNFTFSKGIKIFGGGNVTVGAAFGDNGKKKFFLTVGGMLGAGFGGGFAAEGFTSIISGTDNPDDIAGTAYGLEAGIGVKDIGGKTIGANTNFKTTGAGSLGISGGPSNQEYEAHIGVTVSYTFVFGNIDAMVNKVKLELKKKKVPEKEIKRTEEIIRKKVKI